MFVSCSWIVRFWLTTLLKIKRHDLFTCFTKYAIFMALTKPKKKEKSQLKFTLKLFVQTSFSVSFGAFIHFPFFVPSNLELNVMVVFSSLSSLEAKHFHGDITTCYKNINTCLSTSSETKDSFLLRKKFSRPFFSSTFNYIHSARLLCWYATRN